MQLYECTVRLNGSMLNEVRKINVTAAEIAVLRAIHQQPEAGVEAITQIKPGKQTDRSDHEERERLENIYGFALSRDERLRSLNNILGHPSVPLPKTIPGVDSLPPPKTGRRAKVEKVEPEVSSEDEEETIGEQEFA